MTGPKAEKGFFLITIDVEDWFQVENFKRYISYENWSSCELRVESNTHLLLDMLDSPAVEAPFGSEPPRATFFVLGWVARRLPGIVREIHSRGHEVASHGYRHELCSCQGTKDLEEDLLKSKELLEDITGSEVLGYRAPSFSIDPDILERVRECGYLYDSSYNSFALHDRYGTLQCEASSQNGASGSLVIPMEDFYELPISNIRMGGHTIPWGGGAYFRIIPEGVFRMGVRFILKRQGFYLMYLHPWELDPAQPKVKEASRFQRFRHYTNLHKTSRRMRNLISAFNTHAFITCKDYIRSVI